MLPSQMVAQQEKWESYYAGTALTLQHYNYNQLITISTCGTQVIVAPQIVNHHASCRANKCLQISSQIINSNAGVAIRSETMSPQTTDHHIEGVQGHKLEGTFICSRTNVKHCFCYMCT